MQTERLAEIQQTLTELQVGGWLFYDVHGRDELAYRILGLDDAHLTTRRWFYCIPATGGPWKLVHAVEPQRLDALPGRTVSYGSWRQLESALAELLGPLSTVAMQYSPRAAIPALSVVDGGTVELVRAAGVDVVSSADLVQRFEALVDEAGFASHRQAGLKIQAIKDGAFARAADCLRQGKSLTEYDLQQWIVARFADEGLDCMGHRPIVGVNGHPANPHFEPTLANAVLISPGDCLLVDLWAKLAQPKSIFYDITWCAYVGREPPAQYVEIFSIVVQARRAALELLRQRLAAGEPCLGRELDACCRAVIEAAGYGQFFVHRTGHSIGEEVHGLGVNIDDYETRDERAIVPGCLFSLEPGIYLPGEMAVRSEIDVYVTKTNEAVVVGAEQQQLVLIEVP